jgi:cardiolipin synthase
MGALLGPNFVAGNGITPLVNGEQIFGAMLRAIRGARKSVNLETYVFQDGVIAREFSEALAERARAGVEVNVILDAQGTAQMGAANLAMMRDAGASVQKYHHLFSLDLRRFNNRTHRKLLIIDGQTGFIGGVGIADQWVENANSPREWRDNHYRVTGPVVAQLQGIFMDDWLKTRGTLLQGPAYFPPLSPAGPYLAHAFKSSPRMGEINLELMYRLAIASAQKSLLIENPYFLPDKRVREALIQAAKRGVKVEIIVPGRYSDHKMVRIASLRHWPELLRAGIKIYEYGPSMTHVKLMIVDGIFSSIGSANFDGRSMRLNDEANLDVLDRSFADQHLRLFERDRGRSKEVKLEDTRTLFGFPFRHVLEILSPQF